MSALNEFNSVQIILKTKECGFASEPTQIFLEFNSENKESELKAEIITNNKSKRKKAREIVRLYNELTSSFEKGELGHIDACEIAHVPGIAGGVWLEIFNKTFTCVFFAAIEKDHQGQGHLKACLEALRVKWPIHAIQIDLFDDGQVWRHLGWTNDNNFNLSKVLTHLSEKEFSELCTLANGLAK